MYIIKQTEFDKRVFTIQKNNIAKASPLMIYGFLKVVGEEKKNAKVELYSVPNYIKKQEVLLEELKRQAIKEAFDIPTKVQRNLIAMVLHVFKYREMDESKFFYYYQIRNFMYNLMDKLKENGLYEKYKEFDLTNKPCLSIIKKSGIFTYLYDSNCVILNDDIILDKVLKNYPLDKEIKKLIKELC